MGDLSPIRSWLYAPGNSPRLLEKVFGAGADAVILDLEDAVSPAEKERARTLVAEAVVPRSAGGPAVFVRINHPASTWASADVDAVVRPGLAGLRVPKVEDATTIQQVSDWVAVAEERAGLPRGGLALVGQVESAAGVWRAAAIAAASPRMLALSFGAVDFARDVQAEVGPDGQETLYVRSHLVLVSRVAGIRPPVDSVYPYLADDAGLEASTRQGRALGFFGRACIHPCQVPIVNAVYTPSAAEVERARAIVETAAAAEAHGSGVLRLPDGTFVDRPVVARAEAVLHLAAALDVCGEGKVAS